MSRTLVAYYSNSGFTRAMAERIARQTGADLWELRPEEPYSPVYKELLSRAMEEIRTGVFPALAADIESLNDYDAVFVGTPNWCGTVAPPVSAFLNRHDFSGKTVIPFCTHGGSGEANCLRDIGKQCPGARLAKGIALLGREIAASYEAIDAWLREIPIG